MFRQQLRGYKLSGVVGGGARIGAECRCLDSSCGVIGCPGS